MTYSEPMPGYGVVKFSVRQGGTLVIGQLLGEAGEELGIRAETLVRPSETIEMAKARIRERLRSKYRKERNRFRTLGRSSTPVPGWNCSVSGRTRTS